MTATVNPGVGYRVNDTLSVGGGFSIMYAKLGQEVAVRNILDPMDDGRLKIDQDDTSMGFNLGILLTPSSRTRLGLTYRSAIDLEFDDIGELSNVGPVLTAALQRTGLAGKSIDLGMTVPQAVMFSFYQQLDERLALVGNIGWQDWSEYGKTELTISSPESTTFSPDLKYDDTWHFALGTQYRLAKEWLWSLGFAYDSSPCGTENRSPAAPFDRALRIGTGIQYDWNKNVTIGGVYEYIDCGNADFDMQGGVMQGDLKGHYSQNNIHCIAANVIWKL